jgi:uncharacterized protein (TIGR02246 family)
MKRLHPAVWCALVVAVAACSPSNEAENEPAADGTATMEKSSVDPAADQAALNLMRDEWVEAANRDDAATVATKYTADAIYMSGDGSVLEGSQAIQAAFAESFKATSDLVVNEGKGEVVGDMSYSSGTYKHKATINGKTNDVEGVYLVVSQRQADGSWKIVRHASATKAAAKK